MMHKAQGSGNGPVNALDKALRKALAKKYPQINFLDVPLLDVSSSLIRKMIREKKSVRYLLPDNVHEQVMKSGYYK